VTSRDKLIELCFSVVVEKSVTSSKPHDCSEILDSGERSNGVYTVYLGCRLRPVKVYCDMSTDGGGWTVCIIAFSYGNTFMSYVDCVSKKDTTQPPTIISTIIARFQLFLVQILLNIYANERGFDIPPHLFIVRTLPWETLRL